MLVKNGRPVRCLLMGYNGMGNTGSDVRLLTAIEDVRAAFGEMTRITVASMNPARTRAILPRDDRIQVVRISFSPFRFLPSAWVLGWRHDVTMLIEGSTFKQNFSPWLLYAYLSMAKIAEWCGSHVVAYAVDVGTLSPFHAYLTQRIANKMSLIITRTEMARDRLIAMGVYRPIMANTDTAFQLQSDTIISTTGRRCVGIAPMEFFNWPVRLKLRGDPEERYRWPFSFTWDDKRRARSQAMIENFVRLIQHAIREHDLDIRLIAMEDVDVPVCKRIQASLAAGAMGRVSVVASRTTDPREMAAILRGLDALVTSRYHACVLSMGNAVPQIAVSHDERLQSIYSEMGIARDYLLDYRRKNLADRMIAAFDSMIENSESLSQQIREMVQTRFQPLCSQNRIDLTTWARTAFDSAAPEVSKVQPNSFTDRPIPLSPALLKPPSPPAGTP